MVFMMTRLSSTTLLATLAVAAAANASATPDRIYKSDGSIVDSVDVISEALDRVTYKPEKGRGEEEVESELVLRVEFTEQPEDVAAAEVDATGQPAQNGGYETDLFGNPLPEAQRTSRRARPAGLQITFGLFWCVGRSDSKSCGRRENQSRQQNLEAGRK